jgi:hypothetical protein
VKCRIGYDKQTHLKFISEYLPQLNKKQVEEKPALFGGESADSYLEHMAGKHFKFIVSPESQRVDNEALVRTLVKRLEKATGHRFRWLAACHTDTAHNHAHLLINGVDAGGREVPIDPPFIRHTIRDMTRQICTEMIGGRTPEEISASKQIAYKSARYCFIDKTIEERSRPGPAGESLVSAFDELTGKRLDYLRSLGLARNAPGTEHSYLLDKDWSETLKNIGRYNTYLNARNALLLKGRKDLSLYTEQSGTIEGVVTKRYVMNDENSWANAVLVENEKLGKSWYVPLYKPPARELENAPIRCVPRKNQKGHLSPRLMIKRPRTGRNR